MERNRIMIMDFILEDLKMVKDKDLVFMIGLMETDMLGNGSMAKNKT